MQTAGASHNWLKNTLCQAEIEEAARPGVSPYQLIDEAVAGVPAGADGVLFLPYMLGERTPWWNPNARGAFIGLNLATRREDMLRAVLEGITMNLGIIVNIFRGHVPIDAITVDRRRGAQRGVAADDGGRLRLPRAVAQFPGRGHLHGRGGDRRRGGRRVPRFRRDSPLRARGPHGHAQPGEPEVYRRLMPVFEKAYRVAGGRVRGPGEVELSDDEESCEQ